MLFLNEGWVENLGVQNFYLLEKSNININNKFYYMAVSHKDWELPNSRIWLAEIDIDRGLDFPI